VIGFFSDVITVGKGPKIFLPCLSKSSSPLSAIRRPVKDNNERTIMVVKTFLFPLLIFCIGPSFVETW
jgi:hypothetical protein